jgi:nitrate reductase delta subunit
VDSAFAVVLDYPTDDVLARRVAIASTLSPQLAGFAEWWANADERIVRERYVADFDLRGGTALHLTYHRFGDRRDRGRALIALKRLLREAGWELARWELPDYLPLLLELAAADPDVGLPLLADHRAEIEAIRRSLAAAESPWAELLGVVCDELPPVDEDEVTRLLDEGPPTELVGLEAVRA